MFLNDNADRLTEDYVLGLLVVDLKKILKARGLKVGGLKTELQQRLLDDIRNSEDGLPQQTAVHEAPTRAPVAQLHKPSTVATETPSQSQPKLNTVPAGAHRSNIAAQNVAAPPLVMPNMSLIPTYMAPTAGMRISPMHFQGLPQHVRMPWDLPPHGQFPPNALHRPPPLLYQPRQYHPSMNHTGIYGMHDVNLIRNSLSAGLGIPFIPQQNQSMIPNQPISTAMPGQRRESGADPMNAPVNGTTGRQTMPSFTPVSVVQQSELKQASTISQTSTVPSVKREPGVELEWEYSPHQAPNLWLPLEEAVSEQLNVLVTQSIAVHDIGRHRYDLHGRRLVDLDKGIAMALRQAPKGTSPVSKLPRSCWHSVIEFVKLGFDPAEAVDGVKVHGNNLEEGTIYLVTRRENREENAQIALAQNASKELFELEEANKRTAEKKQKDTMDLFRFHNYSRSFVLNVFRAHPPLQAAVYEKLDVRRPLQVILDLELKCTKWYPESVEYFKQLSKSVSQVSMPDLATFLAKTAGTIEREVSALPTVAGATPLIFRQARKRPMDDDDCCIIEGQTDAVDDDDSDVECIAVHSSGQRKAPIAIIDLD